MKHSLKEDNRPADLWYWDDWFSSFDVRACSAASRGVWVDMLGVMSKAKIKGTLAINGRQADSKDIAKITGDSIEVVEAAISEMERNNVFSRLEDGTIINRRMFDEAELSRTRANAGSKGAANRWQKESDRSEKQDGKRHGKPMAPLEDEDGNGSSSSLSSPTAPSKNSPFFGLADFLCERVRINTPFQKISKTYQEDWADEFRLMVEIDKVPVESIRPVMDWATQDSFWKTNIRSASSFRRQFGQLEAKSRVERKASRSESERMVGAPHPKSAYVPYADRLDEAEKRMLQDLIDDKPKGRTP